MSRKRIFTSFAIEDARLRDLFVGQAQSSKTPFEITDMSVKEPWDSEWKIKCRSKLRGCEGVVGIITKNTVKASGQLWELQFAYDEKVPVLLIYGYSDDRPKQLPDPVAGRRIFTWTWDNITSFVDGL